MAAVLHVHVQPEEVGESIMRKLINHVTDLFNELLFFDLALNLVC